MPDLELFFSPKSVAVIGASHTQGKLGYTILENIKLTFTGKIYPINPNTTEIMGLNAYPSVLAVPEPIDMAVIVVKAEIVESILNECIKKKIKAAIVISSGFSEVGQKELEEKLRKLSKSIRIIGPNCLGIYIPKRIDTLFSPRDRLKRPPEGSIAFITQSGAVGGALLDIAAEENVGISKFVSYGNRVDIGENDLLEYLDKDIGTRCIVMYLESTQDGQKLVELAKRIVKKKPIVAIKAGKTAKGAEAVASHTGALAGPAELFSAAFKQGGIIEAKTSDELFDYAKVLANQPILKDKKIAIITDGGGLGVLAADAAVQAGLELPALAPETLKALKGVLPTYAVPHNPVDLTGDATAERFAKTLEAVFKDKGISGVVCIVLLQIPTLGEEIVDVLRDAKMYGKPFTVCTMGSTWTRERAKKLEGFGIPVYASPERAAKALSVLLQYSDILKRK